MSGESASKIINDMSRYIAEKGGKPSDWFVGIASDCQELFDKRRVPREGHPHVYFEACNSREAAAIEAHFRQFGFDVNLGGVDSGDETEVYVYAYLKSPVTRP
jgi:hypothetical protein